MNVYLQSELSNMISLVKSFEKVCYLSTKKDDNMISKEEEKQLKKIKKASKRFVKELTKLSD